MGYGRDGIYSAWHRRDSIQRYVGALLAPTLSMIDLDATIWIEYNGIRLAVALMETARDTGHDRKPVTVITDLARRAGLFACLVLYKPSSEENPVSRGTADIEYFRVRQLWPNPKTPGFRIYTPDQWAHVIYQIRAWGLKNADKLQQGYRVA